MDITIPAKVTLNRVFGANGDKLHEILNSADTPEQKLKRCATLLYQRGVHVHNSGIMWVKATDLYDHIIMYNECEFGKEFIVCTLDELTDYDDTDRF